MEPALWAAKTGLDAQQTQMTVTANNLANVNTTGFKKGRAVFDDLLYQNVSQVGANTSQNTQSPTGLNLGTGTRVVATEKNYTQGNLNNTGNSLDLAIQGRGFFQVLQPSGVIAYTRDGSFQLNAQGQLVNAQGYQVQPAVTIPTGAQSITVGADGTISVQLAGQTTPTTVGTVQLADFINPAGLQDVGNNLAVESASSGTAVTANAGLNGMGTLVQGSVESSNVDVVEELVNMIETQQAYEMNSRAVETTDQMLQFATQNM
ncbi:MAG TPA: flagellar basal-body rod protein FlgG [Steroidobacteraceae bacterium]|nr:flagellar basal-body rod protein FlgG [Steroidobacteraceae bacterium]